MGHEVWAGVFTMKFLDPSARTRKVLLPRYTRWSFELLYSSDSITEHITIAGIADGRPQTQAETARQTRG
jgi:hypothetical protein